MPAYFPHPHQYNQLRLVQLCQLFIYFSNTMCFQYQVSREQILMMLDNMDDKCISHIFNLLLNIHSVKGLRCRRMRLETHGYMYFQSRYKDLGQRGDPILYLGICSQIKQEMEDKTRVIIIIATTTLAVASSTCASKVEKVFRTHITEKQNPTIQNIKYQYKSIGKMASRPE